MTAAENQKLRVLFISRAYPPVIGGIENQNAGIANALGEITPVTVIANRRGKKFLPLFIPWSLLVMLLTLPRHDAVLFGDGVLAPLGVLGKFFSQRVKFFCIVHGLDVTYADKNSLLGKIYRLLNIPSLKRLDKLIMVGTHTISEAVRLGVPRKKCVFIPNGLNPKDLRESHTRAQLERVLGMDLRDKKVILRIGRFVPHKGVPWFLEKVLPQLPDNFIFVAAGGRSGLTVGDRDAYAQAEKIVRRHNLQDRVKLLTNIDWTTLKILFNTADVVVSPNIEVPGSMEGFGINAIEAAVCERVVLASDLQGLKNAIHHGKNGFLLPHGQPEVWREEILRVCADDFDRESFGRRAREYTIENFSWEHIARKYYDIMEVGG